MGISLFVYIWYKNERYNSTLNKDILDEILEVSNKNNFLDECFVLEMEKDNERARFCLITNWLTVCKINNI